METKDLVDTFNNAMRDIRHGFWTFEGSEANRKILAEGIMKMEKIMDPLAEILFKTRV